LIPHESKIVNLTLTGDQIGAILEQSIQNVYTESPQEKVGGMIQVSGLSFRYDPSRARGMRVVEVKVGGSSLNEGRTYRVVTNGMLADGGHNYRTFLEGRDRTEGPGQYDVVKAWFSKAGLVQPPPADAIQNVGNERRESMTQAQYRVVFHLDEAGAEKFESVLRNVSHLIDDLGADQTKVELVAHGPGIDLLVKESPYPEKVRKLQNRGVIMVACHNTLQQQSLTEDDLLPDVTVVPAGIGEIVRRQQQGWQYVRP